jgi:hypothetical protein
MDFFVLTALVQNCSYSVTTGFVLFVLSALVQAFVRSCVCEDKFEKLWFFGARQVFSVTAVCALRALGACAGVFMILFGSAVRETKGCMNTSCSRRSSGVLASSTSVFVLSALVHALLCAFLRLATLKSYGFIHGPFRHCAPSQNLLRTRL